MTSIGELKKDRVLKRVLKNTPEFSDKIICLVLEINRGVQVTGEDIRFIAESMNIHPEHHNAWGASINAVLQKGLIVDTGKHTSLKDPSSHARRTPVYKRTGRKTPK